VPRQIRPTTLQVGEAERQVRLVAQRVQFLALDRCIANLLEQGNTLVRFADLDQGNPQVVAAVVRPVGLAVHPASRSAACRYS